MTYGSMHDTKGKRMQLEETLEFKVGGALYYCTA